MLYPVCGNQDRLAGQMGIRVKLSFYISGVEKGVVLPEQENGG